MSPYAASRMAPLENLHINFSHGSLYNYIHQYNDPIESSQLSMKNKRKKSRPGCAHRLARNNVKGERIERRPVEVNNRNDTGYWEMDSVASAKGEKNVDRY